MRKDSRCVIFKRNRGGCNHSRPTAPRNPSWVAIRRRRLSMCLLTWVRADVVVETRKSASPFIKESVVMQTRAIHRGNLERLYMGAGRRRSRSEWHERSRRGPSSPRASCPRTLLLLLLSQVHCPLPSSAAPTPVSPRDVEARASLSLPSRSRATFRAWVRAPKVLERAHVTRPRARALPPSPPRRDTSLGSCQGEPLFPEETAQSALGRFR